MMKNAELQSVLACKHTAVVAVHYSCTYLKDKHKDEEQCHIENTVHGHAGATNTYHKEHYGNHPNPELGQQALNKVTQPVHGLTCLLGSICI
jgi:hypothetical protein